MHATTISMYVCDLKYLILRSENLDQHYLQVKDHYNKVNYNKNLRILS
jgi:hypothetical protein